MPLLCPRPGVGGLHFGIGFAPIICMKNTAATKGQTSFVIKELEEVIRKGNAHASFDEAVKGIKPDLIGVAPDGLPYSLWPQRSRRLLIPGM